jgi:hypothetical protein
MENILQEIIDNLFETKTENHDCKQEPTTGRKEASKIDLQTVRGPQPKTETNTFYCDTCLKSFATKTRLEKHIRCSPLEIQRKRQSNKQSSRTSPNILKKHIKEEGDGETKQNQCKICEKVLGNGYKLKMHITVVHDKVKPFKCLICPKNFGYERDLKNHTRAVHDKIQIQMQERLNPFQCQVCQKMFTQKHNLQSHILAIHEKKKLFQCHLCGQTFGFKVSMYRHTLKFCSQDSAISNALKPLSTTTPE